MGSKKHLFLIYTEVPGRQSVKTHQPCPSLASHAITVYPLSVAPLNCKLSGQRVTPPDRCGCQIHTVLGIECLTQRTLKLSKSRGWRGASHTRLC